jgi:hypothetical protein
MQNNMIDWEQKLENCIKTIEAVEEKMISNEKEKEEHLKSLNKMKSKLKKSKPVAVNA